MTNSTDRMSFRDLKLNHEHESYTADLKIYSQLAHLKKPLKNLKYDNCSVIKESCKGISFLICEDLIRSLVKGPVLPQGELSTDFKNAHFYF